MSYDEQGGEVVSVLGKHRPSGLVVPRTILLQAMHESTSEWFQFYKAFMCFSSVSSVFGCVLAGCKLCSCRVVSVFLDVS